MATPGKTGLRTRRAAAVKETSEKPPGSSARFGVIIEINGQNLALSGDALSDAKAKGVEFTIRNPVMLGKLTDVDVLGFKPGEILTDLPSPLDSVGSAIANTTWTVEYAHVKVPGSDDKAKDSNAATKYTIEINGEFAAADQEKFTLGPLKLKGIVFGATNEPQPNTNEAQPSKT